MQSEDSFEQQKRKKKDNQDKKDGNAHQADKIRDQNDDNSNVYQIDSAIAFASIATISSSIHSLLPKSSVIVLWLADHLSIAHTPQSSSIRGPQVQAKVQVLKFYRKHLEKKFPNLFAEISISKIIELSTENPSLIEVNLLTVTIPKRWTDYIVFLESNNRYESDSWTHDNQLYVYFPFQVDNSLNSLTYSIQLCINITIVMKDSIGSSKVNYICIALSQNRFVLSNLLITMILSKYEKALCSLYKGKKTPYDSFYEDG